MSNIQLINVKASNIGSGNSFMSPPSQISQSLNPTKSSVAGEKENQSVSSISMGQLMGLPGHKLLQYIRSPQFGLHGESNKLYEIILELISKMQNDNDLLQVDNESLAKSNVQYEGLVKSHQLDINESLEHASTFGDHIAKWDGDTSQLEKRESKFAKVERKLDKDMSDLIEYTKWISGESEKLRDRVRASERVINDLRRSGEASVESLMESLYLLKIRAEGLDDEATELRETINEKELRIKGKEEHKGRIKATIEVENADRENEIQALRNQAVEQRALLERQRKQLNELRVHCEFTQTDMIKGNKELNRKKHQKNQLSLQYQEVDQATMQLKNQHGKLADEYRNKMDSLKGNIQAMSQKDGQALEKQADLNIWGKPKAADVKTRSGNAFFGEETVFQKRERLNLEETIKIKKAEKPKGYIDIPYF